MSAPVNVNQLQCRDENEEKLARETIYDMFEYHKPDTAKIDAMSKVRESLCDAALAIVKHVPPSADRSTAMRKLREARMDANSAITHGGKY